MKIQNIFPIEKASDLIAVLDFNPPSEEGYATGQIELPYIGLSFELLPNQFYRYHGQVDKLPFTNVDAEGLCYGRLRKGTFTVDTYILRNNDPLIDTFINGHEEGHACFYFGKSMELYDLIGRSKNDKMYKSLMMHFLDEKYFKAQDKVMLQGLIASSMTGRLPEGVRMMKSLFTAFLEKQKQENKQIEQVCNVCGICAAERKGYDLKHVIQYLSDKGF